MFRRFFQYAAPLGATPLSKDGASAEFEFSRKGKSQMNGVIKQYRQDHHEISLEAR